MIIAISFDLLRWHFRRISCLLEPYNAINVLTKQVCSRIVFVQRRVATSSFRELKKIPKREWSSELLGKIELKFYGFFKNPYTYYIIGRINELEDITLQAITRSDNLTTRHGINGIVKIICTYLNSRKENLQIYPTGFLIFGSDLDNTINPVYEKLLNICRLAIHNKDEQAGILTVRGFSCIAQRTTHLVGKIPHSAPLANLPIGYLTKCVEFSKGHELDEITWNVVNELLKISKTAPINVTISDIHTPVLNALSAISTQQYLQDSDHIAKQAILNACEIAIDLTKQRHYDFRSYLWSLLKDLEKLVPLMIFHEKPLDIKSFPPYSIAEEVSLGHIVELAASNIESNKEKTWVNPYADFLEINEKIYMHFRHIAENNFYDVQDSFLSCEITNTIKDIAKVHLDILRRKITGNPIYNNKLVNQVGWYLSFFWTMFDKKRKVLPNKAEQVSDAMSVIGMQFLNEGYSEVADDSLSNICYVAKCYIEKSENPNPYSIANILERVQELLVFSEHKENKTIVQKANREIQQVIDLATIKQQKTQEAFDLRCGQLQKFLSDYDPHIIPTSSRDYLKLFIQRSKT